MRTSKGPLLLGIDAGTSRIRAIVFAIDGGVVAEASQAAPTTRPRSGWAQQDADELWLACCQAIRTAIAGIERPTRIRGLAIGSVGEAFVPLDSKGQPTYPVIAWYDERPTQELNGLLTRIDRKRLFAITGLSADPTFTLTKLLWLKTHAPDALGHTRMILNITHYLAWRLTGIPGSDCSQASRSLAFDLGGLRWADDLIRECGLNPAIFQSLRPLGVKLGPLLPEVASGLGLPKDCSVGVGGHDHLIGALAADALRPGKLLNSLGTAEAVTLTVDKPINEPQLAAYGFNQGALVVDKRAIFYVFGGLQTSGASVEWFRSLFDQAIDHATLIREAEAVAPGAEGVTFVPDLRGKLVPTPDPLARGAWLGLTADTNRAVLFRAILEGLAFESRLSIDAMAGLDGLPSIETIRAIGGNTKNKLLLRIKASVYRQPIIASDLPEATALGAALLGGLAAGLWPDVDRARSDLIDKTHRVNPRDDWAVLYEHRYHDLFCKAYRALKPLNHTAHKLQRF